MVMIASSPSTRTLYASRAVTRQNVMATESYCMRDRSCTQDAQFYNGVHFVNSSKCLVAYGTVRVKPGSEAVQFHWFISYHRSFILWLAKLGLYIKPSTVSSFQSTRSFVVDLAVREKTIVRHFLGKHRRHDSRRCSILHFCNLSRCCPHQNGYFGRFYSGSTTGSLPVSYPQS